MRTECLFNGALYVHLPDDFGVMSEETIHRIYPSRERPDVCFLDKASTCCFTLSLLNKALSPGEVLSAAQEIRRMIQSLYPGSLLSDVITKTVYAPAGARFSFRTNSTKGALYNTMYIFTLNGQMLLCTTNCPLDNEDSKKRMQELISGIEPTSKEGAQ